MSSSPKYLNKPTVQVVAIRREDISMWERRAPLIPNHVKILCENNIKVIVQPSNARIFTNDAYRNVGAEIKEDIDQASVIIGLKNVPIDKLSPHKTYCYYANVSRGEAKCMPTLKALLCNNIRLIDYEELIDSETKLGPNVVFSSFAGLAAFVNILNGLGLRLLSLGHNTPFLNIGLAHSYRRAYQATQAVREIGYEIALGQMPKSIGPIVFVVLGVGNYSKGVQSIFVELPHEYIQVKDLPQVYKKLSLDKVYAVLVDTKDFLRKKDRGDFVLEEYLDHPDRYESVFSKEIAPYATVIMNCLKWDSRFPKIMFKSDVKSLLTACSFPKDDDTQGFQLPHRLLAICDVSSNPSAMDYITKETSLAFPFLIYNSEEQQHGVDFTEPGVMVCNIDNLHSQFALEASEYFSTALLPYIPSIITSDAKKSLKSHTFHPVVRNAIITGNGKLTSKFEFLQAFL